MVNLVAVSKSRHTGKGWRRPKSPSFASGDAVVPICGMEFAKAMKTIPIAFVKQDATFVAVAVLSPFAGQNLFIGLDGQWLGGYVPAAIRGYPFRAAFMEGTSDYVLCIDEDSGLLVDADDSAEALFDGDGGPSPSVQPIWQMLRELEASRALTVAAVAALSSAELIEPWLISVNLEGQDRQVEGLHRIDEAALNALPDDELLKLRAAGALPIAYGQLFSMGQLSVFQTLAQLRSRQTPVAPTELPESLDTLFGMGNDDYLRFN